MPARLTAVVIVVTVAFSIFVGATIYKQFTKMATKVAAAQCQIDPNCK